jgi:type I restriction enzyme S subunit
MTNGEWPKVPLDEVAELNPRLAETLTAEDNVSFVPMSAVSAETAGITDEVTRTYAEVAKGYTPFVSGDVLVAKITPCFENGKIAQALLTHRAGFGSTEFHVVRPRADKLDARYTLHFLRLGRVRLAGERRMTGSAGQRRVPENFLAKIEIPLPPLGEQRRIAEVLDRAEALRAKRRAALSQLDSLTQSIFLDLFGDAGENPKGWPVRTVTDYVAEFQGGKSIESESGENVVTRNRVLKVSAVTGMKYLAHESKPVPDSYEPAKEHFARPGDLLFSRANTTELVGAVAYVESTPPNLLLPDKLWRFVWRQPAKVEPLFIWALFQTPPLRREIGRRATGTSGSMKNISQEKVFGISTILPPLPLQREFARRISAVEKLKTAQRAALAELDALFASLQHRAFRGEL